MTAWVLTGLNTTDGSKNVTPNAVTGDLSDAVFSADGTKLYIAPNSGGASQAISQYTLSIAWDITTAVYASKSYADPSWDLTLGNPSAIGFKTDGTKLYVVTSGTGGLITQYTLGTPWDISTATPAGIIFAPVSGHVPIGLRFKSDGTRLFTADIDMSPASIISFTLGTPWNISTATIDATSFNVTGQIAGGNITGIDLKTDGTKAYLYDGDSNIVYQYTIGTPYDLSTCTYSGISVNDVNMQTLTGIGGPMQWNSDGSSLYVGRVDTLTKVYQYNLPAPPAGSGTIMTCSF